MAVKSKSPSAAKTAKAPAPVGRAVDESLEAAEAAGAEVAEEAAEKTYEKTANQAKAQVEQVFAMSKQTAEKAVETSKQAATQSAEAAFKGYEDLAVLGRDNLDALVRSNNAVAKGIEAIGKQVMAFAQSAMEENVAQARALVSVRDIQELVDLQNDFAKKRLEATIAESARLTELSTQVANEAFEPLRKRMDATVETVLKARVA